MFADTFINAEMHACLYNIYVCVYVPVSICLCLYLCMYVFTYANMSACMHVFS